MQTTFARLLLKHAAERPQVAAMREKEYGIWQALTWADLATMVEHLACGLHEAGLKRGDHMVVVGANRPRLYATMLAVQALGAVPIPLYQDAAALECVFPVNNAEVKFAFAEDQEQVDKLLEIRPQCPQLSNIYFDDLVWRVWMPCWTVAKLLQQNTLAFSKLKLKKRKQAMWRRCFLHPAQRATLKAWCIRTTACSTRQNLALPLTN
jgi:long-subunit acyl-CoA synthetase (AMP-forming)